MGTAHRGATTFDADRVVGPGDVVLVTGAAGVIGRVVVETLADAGLRVVAADRVPADGTGAELVLVGDTRDPVFVTKALRGLGAPVDAVVHLAAIPAPGQVSEEQTLVQNVEGAYLVLDGAGRAGVRTTVAASSFSAYGYAWADRDLSPVHVPVDETEEDVVIDSYGLSKVVTEQVGAFVTRRWGTPTTLLRFPFVGHGERLRRFIEGNRADAGSGRRDLWAWVDTRDAARAVLAALGSGVTGHHVFNVAAPDSASEVPTLELLARYHPTATIRRPLDEFGSLVDTSHVHDVLGFEAQHSWREETAPAAAAGA